jgi:periplasmic protein TonB
MLSSTPTRRLIDSTLVSVAAHVVVLAALLAYAHRHPIRVFNLPGTAAGTHLDVVYLPGRASMPSPRLKTKIRPAVHPAAAALQPAESPLPPVMQAPALPPRPHLTFTPPAPTPDLSPSSASADTAGSDSFGSGDIQIAFTTYSPSPAPDLSVLPPGMQGDVILDVTIDSNGRVADLQVLKTPGYGIESSVIRTVRTWVFRPATKDGVPIASVQELHFHYGPV